MAVHSGARGAPIWGPAEILQGYAAAPAGVKGWTTFGMIDTSVRRGIDAPVGIRKCRESKLCDLRGIEGLTARLLSLILRLLWEDTQLITTR